MTRPRRRADDQRDIRRALDALRRVVQALRAGPPHRALSRAQLFALQQIADHPNASINDLAALTFTHQSSVSVVVGRLVESGLVVKVSAPADRRRQLLAVTAKGRRALQRAPRPIQQRLIRVLGALSRPERRRLARSLTRLATAIAPDMSATPPPMLFEDADRRSRR
jgi:DNA-binding MarR family transcriptional regulator